MSEVFKFVLRLVGIGALIVVFGAAYFLATALKVAPDKWDSETKTVGQIGGYHWLSDIKHEPQTDFNRIAIYTSLNRVSPLETEINTPYIQAELKNSVDDDSIATTESGPYHLLLTLADTDIVDLNTTPPQLVFVGEERQLIEQDNLNDIWLYKPQDDSTYQIVVGLDEPVKFRLQVNPDDTGIVWLDILK